MPPFSTEAFEALEKSSTLNQWWDFYKNEFPKVLEKNNILIASVSHPVQFNLNDTYMFDGWHPSEVYIGHLVKRMIEQAPDSSYLKNVNIENLRTLIENASIPLTFHLPSTSSP